MSSINNANKAFASIIESIPGKKDDTSVLLLDKSGKIKGYSKKNAESKLKGLSDSPHINSRGQQCASPKAERVLAAIWQLQFITRTTAGALALEASESLPKAWHAESWPKDAFNSVMDEYSVRVMNGYGNFLGAKAASSKSTIILNRFSGYNPITIGEMKEAFEETRTFATQLALDMFGELHKKQQGKAEAFLQAGVKHDPSSNATTPHSPSPSPSPPPSSSQSFGKQLKKRGTQPHIDRSKIQPKRGFANNSGSATGNYLDDTSNRTKTGSPSPSPGQSPLFSTSHSSPIPDPQENFGYANNAGGLTGSYESKLDKQEDLNRILTTVHEGVEGESINDENGLQESTEANDLQAAIEASLKISSGTVNNNAGTQPDDARKEKRPASRRSTLGGMQRQRAQVFSNLIRTPTPSTTPTAQNGGASSPNDSSEEEKKEPRKKD